MENSHSKMTELVAQILSGNDISISDIPDIDLYMDQVTTFIDNKLSHLKRDSEDKLLTKTMINNYTKSKILLTSKNKKYDKHHIILLVLIYYLKQILSISDIHTLFSPLFKNLSTDSSQGYSLDDIYTMFLNIQDEHLGEFEKDMSSKLDMICRETQKNSVENSEFIEMFLTVLLLVSQAYAQKRLAEKIIDEYFNAITPKNNK